MEVFGVVSNLLAECVWKKLVDNKLYGMDEIVV